MPAQQELQHLLRPGRHLRGGHFVGLLPAREDVDVVEAAGAHVREVGQDAAMRGDGGLHATEVPVLDAVFLEGALRGSFAKLSAGEGGEEEVEVGVARENQGLEKEVELVADAAVRDGD